MAEEFRSHHTPGACKVYHNIKFENLRELNKNTCHVFMPLAISCFKGNHLQELKADRSEKFQISDFWITANDKS